jgi:hypothetical protein
MLELLKQTRQFENDLSENQKISHPSNGDRDEGFYDIRNGIQYGSVKF